MKRKYNKMIWYSTGVILAMFALSLSGWMWLIYNSDFEAIYPEQHLAFTGNYIGLKAFEYKGLSANLADYQEYDRNGSHTAKPIRKTYSDCPLFIHINGRTFEVANITPNDMKELGGEEIPGGKRNRVTSWRISSISGFNPPYFLSCNFYKNRVISLYFRIQNPPSATMKSAEPCPISFSFGKDITMRFPITQEQLKKHLGSPSKTHRYMRWP